MADLNESDRSRLDAIVQQMAKNGESEQDIQSVVSDFKQKYASTSLTDKATAYFRGLPNPLTFHPNYGPNVSDVDTGPSYDLMKVATPGTLAMRGIQAIRTARAARAAAAPGAAGVAPYFREGTTMDPQFRGPIPATSGEPLPAGYGFRAPAETPAAGTTASVTFAAPAGVDPLAWGKLTPQVQNAILKGAANRAAGKGYTPPPAGTAPSIEGIPAPRPVHEAAHAIDTHFSPRKAMNLTRHLQEQGVPFEDVSAMVTKAKATGDWDAINALEKDAWTSGKALEASGAAKPGALVPKTPYRPKTADYSDIKGIEETEGTWDRVLKNYPRNVPKPKPPASEGIPAPQGIPVPAWGLQ